MAERIWTAAFWSLMAAVAVRFDLADETGGGHALYLPTAWAEDEDRRLLRHVPEGVTFATKSESATAMPHRTRRVGLSSRRFTGEVHGSLELRRIARTLGFDYAPAVEANHCANTAVVRFSATDR